MVREDRSDAVRGLAFIRLRRLRRQPEGERTMVGASETRRRGLVGGVVLVAVGLIVLIARQAGLDLGDALDNAWPLFIIVPGLALLAAAFVPEPPDGLGFAVSGSVVTTVGAILLYQQTSGNWESWAYIWAVIPMAAGIAIAVYGFLTGFRDIAGNGVRLAGIAVVLFLLGTWYFNAVFETGKAPLDIETWWPVAVVLVGAFIVGRAVLMPAGGQAAPRDRATHGGDRT